MEKNNERFEYTYSAKQQEEIEQIRRKYLPEEEDGLSELKRLDAAVTRPGLIAGLVLGITGTLIFGAGMSLTLSGEESLFGAGIVVSVIGFVILAAAYPAHAKITKIQKAKLGPRILELTEKIRYR